MVTAVANLKSRIFALSTPDADGIYRDGAAQRSARTKLVMDAMASLWNEACTSVPFSVPSHGIGLAAVGSLARGQLGPASDLDLALIYEDRALNDEQLTEFANKLWYPLWDSGVALDHSVRTRAQCESVTDHDLPAAIGWLDVVPVAGDSTLISTTATSILERWRRAARNRLPELLESSQTRLERFARLPYVNQPDVKEAHGGLRDAVLTDALAASWLADRPHGRYDEAVNRLLDVRDCIHLVAGRDTNRLITQYQAPVAAMLGLADPALPAAEREAKSIDDLQTLLAQLGRVIAFSLDSTASRTQRTLVHDRPRFAFFQIHNPRNRGRRAAPKFEQIDTGVALHEGEIVLAPGASVAHDLNLPLRVAVAAAERGLPINTLTLANLASAQTLSTRENFESGTDGIDTQGDCARDSQRNSVHATQQNPARELRKNLTREPQWNDESRALFIRLLATGNHLARTWEELDFVDLPAQWIAQWSAIRNRPSASAAHRFTIDRHMVEVTSQLTRTRPDFAAQGAPARSSMHYDDDHFTALLLAGILHDIGKRPGVSDHAQEGAPLAQEIVRQMGFSHQIERWVTLLVREHLTLSEFATSRDPNDPHSGHELARRVDHDGVLLDMLFDLTRADMCSLGATPNETLSGKIGWSKWRAQLVTQMAAVTLYHL